MGLRLGRGAYDAGQPTQVIDAFGQLITLSYDASGHLLSRTERGNTTSYQYDALGRPTLTDYGLRGSAPSSGCAGDQDCDGVSDSADNCPQFPNPGQEDSDENVLSTPGARAVYTFEEPSGTSATDSAGTYTGTLVGGVSRVAGRFGQGLSLDGVNDHVSFGSTVGNFGTSDFTIGWWMKTTSNNQQLFSKRPDCGGGAVFENRMFSGVVLELYENAVSVGGSVYVLAAELTS